MKTKCHSRSGNCPCVGCHLNCCIESEDEQGLTDTEKLCDEARSYCEACGIDEEDAEDDFDWED